MDLISCRNLLIYLGTQFQGQVVPIFHLALRPKGFLFLGTSENIGHHAQLFSPVDKKSRIFQRRDHAVTQLHSSLFASGSRPPSGGRENRRGIGESMVDLRRSAETRILEQFSPAHVVVNAEGDVLHYSPRTGKYLEAPVGQPSRQLLPMARRGLRLELRSALKEAAESRRRVHRENLVLELEDRVQTINLIVEPFGDLDSDPLFLVVFQDAGEPIHAGAIQAPDQAVNASFVERLEQELRDTKERLQGTIEEYETSVEELKSSNEELQSINEELQSTNEELETSKEELQSVNEELNTVNLELNSKIDEVDRAHSDLRNIFDSTQIATVFLDRNLVIRSFTPAVTAIFNLISSDRGRPLTDIVGHLKDGNLRNDIQSVLERGVPIERNVSTSDDRAHYLMRILPYRERNDVMEGVVVTFVDVTSLMEAQAHQKTLVEELNHRVRNMLTIVNAIANQTMKQSSSMEQFAESFSGRIQAMGRSYGLVSHRNWGTVDLRDIVAGQLQGFASTNGPRIKIDGPSIWFKPTPALALGLVFHEFATNALKYGALSNGTGTIRVNWDVDRKQPQGLTLRWKEANGPAVKKPGQKGFGSQLVEQELEHTLKAKAHFEYGEKGFEATIHVPGEPGLYTLDAADGE